MAATMSTAKNGQTSQELYNALYASCASQPENKVFSQQQLLSLKIIPNNDVNQLLACTQRLTNNGLFKLMMKDGRPCWKVVKKEDAARYKKLTQEEALVFSYIESAGRDGLWTLAIRARTNLHISVFNRCLKTLESQNLVKGVFSAKFPGRKVYILAHLQPSEDISGGPFYTEGKLDDEFVHQLGVWSEKYVAGRSWSHSTVKEPKRKRDISNLTAAQAEDLKAQEFRGEEPAKQRSRRVILPLPPGYTGYPTVPEITKAANESRITPVSLKEAEMRQVMDTLCWDGRVMKVMDGKAYKTVHPAGREDDRDLENGLTESPCGHCPVFDLCEEGGPVNARSCTYFQDWLAF